MSNRRSKIIKQLQERIIKIDEEIDKILQERYLRSKNSPRKVTKKRTITPIQKKKYQGQTYQLK